MRIVYSAIVSEIDVLIDPIRKLPNCSYICYSNLPLKSDIWEIRPLIEQFSTNKLTARFHKMQVPKLIEGERFLWQDGKVGLKQHSILFDKLGNEEFLFFKHPMRDNIYDEAKKVIELGKECPIKVNKQIEKYKKDKFEKEILFETCVFLSRKTAISLVFLDLWWNEILNESCRDQISLPYLLDKFKPNYVIEEKAYKNNYFSFNDHHFKNKKIKFI